MILIFIFEVPVLNLGWYTGYPEQSSSLYRRECEDTSWEQATATSSSLLHITKLEIPLVLFRKNRDLQTNFTFLLITTQKLGISIKTQEVLGRTNRLVSLIRHGPH
jgi:hypothetical protein